MFRKVFQRVQENHKTMKEFEYTKGNITLKFSLRTDTKNELNDFKELLSKAVIDVDKEIHSK